MLEKSEEKVMSREMDEFFCKHVNSILEVYSCHKHIAKEQEDHDKAAYLDATLKGVEMVFAIYQDYKNMKVEEFMDCEKCKSPFKPYNYKEMKELEEEKRY